MREKLINFLQFCKEFGLFNGESSISGEHAVDSYIESPENRILIIDIETCGFNPKDPMVEVGICGLNVITGQTVKLFDSCVREDHFSKEIHGKSWIFENTSLKVDDVLKAPSLENVFDELQVLFADHACTAFNNKFDFSFLEARGFVLNKLECPMQIMTPIMKIPKGTGYKWPNVQEAYNFCFPKNEYIEQHRGYDDSLHEAHIVYELIRRNKFNPWLIK